MIIDSTELSRNLWIQFIDFVWTPESIFPVEIVQNTNNYLSVHNCGLNV